MEDLVAAIDKLPFKVELKTLIKDGNKWTQTFVLPENPGLQFESLDLD